MAILSICILQVEHRNSDGVLATAKASDHAWYLNTIPQVIHCTGVLRYHTPGNSLYRGTLSLKDLPSLKLSRKINDFVDACKANKI